MTDKSFDVSKHAIANAISCLVSIRDRNELAQGGEQSGNWAHVVDAIQWLEKIARPPSGEIIEHFGIGALVPVEVRLKDGAYFCTSPLVKGLLVVTQDKNTIATQVDQALRDLGKAVRDQYNSKPT